MFVQAEWSITSLNSIKFVVNSCGVKDIETDATVHIKNIIFDRNVTQILSKFLLVILLKSDKKLLVLRMFKRYFSLK